MRELHVACFSKYHVHKYNFKARESVQIQIRVREYTISANCEQFKQERLTGVRPGPDIEPPPPHPPLRKCASLWCVKE